jgi:hypothetical protein
VPIIKNDKTEVSEKWTKDLFGPVLAGKPFVRLFSTLGVVVCRSCLNTVSQLCFRVFCQTNIRSVRTAIQAASLEHKLHDYPNCQLVIWRKGSTVAAAVVFSIGRYIHEGQNKKCCNFNYSDDKPILPANLICLLF